MAAAQAVAEALVEIGSMVQQAVAEAQAAQAGWQ
jgi:hypothetical protein